MPSCPVADSTMYADRRRAGAAHFAPQLAERHVRSIKTRAVAGSRVAGMGEPSYGRSCQPRGAGAVGQRSVELPAGAELELGEYFAQVVLDGARADEQLGGDLRVGEAVAGQAGDLGLLRGERVARFHGALAGGLAGGGQLAAGPLGESLHADRGEHVV